MADLKVIEAEREEAISRALVAEAALDSIRSQERSAYSSLCHELARLLGPIKPRMNATTNEQLIAKVGQVLIDRDEAAKQARQRVRESLEKAQRFVPGMADEGHPDGGEYPTIRPHEEGDLLRRSDVLAALDSLEDSDG